MSSILYIIAAVMLWIAGALALGWMVGAIKRTGNVLFMDEENVKKVSNRSNNDKNSA